MNRFLCALLLVIAALGAAGPAHAGLRVCNQSDNEAYLALGFFDGKTWGSQGWWRAKAGACADLVKDRLTSRYYYIYAVHPGMGGAWNGNRSFCVGQEDFRSPSRADCLERGFDRKRFFQVDTGDLVDWTENLSD